MATRASYKLGERFSLEEDGLLCTWRRTRQRDWRMWILDKVLLRYQPQRPSLSFEGGGS